MMYRILYNKQEIYGPELDQAVLSPTLELELNAAGRLEFTLPVTRSSTTDDDGNPIWPDDIWNNIQVFKGEVEVYEGDDCIFFGRPLQITRDWNNQKKVICEGALAYFNDTIQETKEYKQKKTPLYNDENYPQGATYNKGFFNKIIDIHNDQLKKDNNYDLSKYIEIGTVNVENSLVWRKTDGESTASVLQSMCLDTNGGYFILRKEWKEEWDAYINKIDWVKSAPMGTDQTIQFGLNLLDISQDLNGSDICTVLYPTGDNDLTVKKATTHTWENPYVIHHAGEDHRPDTHIVHEESSNYIIHVEGYNKYGRVVKQKNFDVDGEEDTVTNANVLYRKAREWLDDQNWEETTIECSAADLHYVYDQTEYYNEDDDPPQKLRLGQTVEVVDAVHGVTRSLPIYKCSMSLDSGVKKITMGTPPKKELTDIVKPSTSTATRNSTGGSPSSGGSGEGGGGGGSSSAPVTDVLIKEPGSDEYGSVVKNKKAKINLSGYVTDVLVGEESVKDGEGRAILDPDELGKVNDVRVDGTSVVSNKIADISIPVKDVRVDNRSVVDSNKIANLSTDDFKTIDPSRVDFLVKKDQYMYNATWIGRILSIPAEYDPLAKSLRLTTYPFFQQPFMLGYGLASVYNKPVEPQPGDDWRDLETYYATTWPFNGFSLNGNSVVYEPQKASNENRFFELNIRGGTGISIDTKNTNDLTISLDSSVDKPNISMEFTDVTPNTDYSEYVIENTGIYWIVFATSNTGSKRFLLTFYDANGNEYTPTKYFEDTNNEIPGGRYEKESSFKITSCICSLTQMTTVAFDCRNSDGSSVEVIDKRTLRLIYSLRNIDVNNITLLTKTADSAFRSCYNQGPQGLFSQTEESEYDTPYTDHGLLSLQVNIYLYNYLTYYNDPTARRYDVGNASTYELTSYTTDHNGNNKNTFTQSPSYEARRMTAAAVAAYDIGPNDEEIDHVFMSHNQFVTSNIPDDGYHQFVFFYLRYNLIFRAPLWEDTSGGGIVIPNPPGNPTADLSKIKVNDTIYGVATPTDIATLQSNFQDGVDAIYDACVAKGSTPASQSLSDVVQGIMDIPQSGGGGDTITYVSATSEYIINQDYEVSTYLLTGIDFISEVTT